MDKSLLRKMILQECGCMAREVELPAQMSAALPMLDILGYGGEGVVKMSGQHDADGGIEYEDSDDYEESSMVKNNLYTTAMQAKGIHEMIEDGDDLPEWVQEKIAIASEMIDVVYDYLTAEAAHMHEAKKPWYMKKRRNMKKTNESEWYDIPQAKVKRKPVKKK